MEELGHFIRGASRNAVKEGVKHIKKFYFPSGKLISNRNPLEKNSGKHIKRHSDTRNNYQISQLDIKSYLAASSLAHLLDGWKYLSGSINALLSGDEGTSIHLAYYAELRSSMSILASQGVGVFNDKHIAVKQSLATSFVYPKNYLKPTGGYVQPKSPTHVFVWDAMNTLTSSNYSLNLDILKIFKVRGIDFYDLPEFFHPQATAALNVDVVKKWLKEWCFDIRTYRLDREGRNEVSYRPQSIKGFESSMDFKDIINTLTNFWQGISPVSSDKFALMDTYLLRKFFNSLYLTINPAENFADLVENSFSQRGIYDNTLIRLLSSQDPFTDDHIIFRHASIQKTTPLSIIARATLLLRVAIGLVSSLYKSAGVVSGDLNFIWESYGVNCGFWRSGNMPEDMSQLWTDLGPSFSDLALDMNNLDGPIDMFSLKNTYSGEINSLSEVNRACLWGIDL